MGFKIKFLSSDCHHKYEEEKHIFMELDINGHYVIIDIGKNHTGKDGIHIIGPIGLDVDHHSINALNVYVPLKKEITTVK